MYTYTFILQVTRHAPSNNNDDGNTADDCSNNNEAVNVVPADSSSDLNGASTSDCDPNKDSASDNKVSDPILHTSATNESRTDNADVVESEIKDVNDDATHDIPYPPSPHEREENKAKIYGAKKFLGNNLNGDPRTATEEPTTAGVVVENTTTAGVVVENTTTAGVVIENTTTAGVVVENTTTASYVGVVNTVASAPKPDVVSLVDAAENIIRVLNDHKYSQVSYTDYETKVRSLQKFKAKSGGAAGGTRAPAAAPRPTGKSALPRQAGSGPLAAGPSSSSSSRSRGSGPGKSHKRRASPVAGSKSKRRRTSPGEDRRRQPQQQRQQQLAGGDAQQQQQRPGSSGRRAEPPAAPAKQGPRTNKQPGEAHLRKSTRKRVKSKKLVVSESEESDAKADETIYCICQKEESGLMVACDNPKCKIEWFHFKCVGLKSKPKGSWYCKECVQSMSNS